MTRKVLTDLRTKVTSMRDELIAKETARLKEENEALASECEHYRQQLIKAEISNGKPQYSVPSVRCSAGDSATAPPAPKVVPTTKAETQQSSDGPQVQPKREKEKSAKKVKDAPKNDAPKAEEPVCVSQLDLRVGLITNVERHPDADALYLEQIDVGEAKPRTVISGLVKFVPIEAMRDRMVVVMCNLKPAKMRGVLSEGMVMCASTPDKVEPIRPPKNAVPGDRVTWTGRPEADYPNPEGVLNPKKKIWERIAPDLKLNGNGETVWMSKQLEVRGKGYLVADSLKDAQVR
ncbi:aminoacyl tRNA synthase complex-interacting multifunctional protein 1 [Galendromus occidentalis]|uniref:Aminoacyl tRNA synthase complex-interacting multifunctional protein 1 n=1 Tax=Galendromus occidentalis TaxID=34638 RepID=A0AAJ6QUQ6_9ACAR|nr:aminoacyl tRNA synthase complex-interacting multifunctional protein 1 [Galendromus occidentalis]